MKLRGTVDINASTGQLTATFDDLPPGLGGEEDVAVYVPYSYQIGGFTLIVARKQIQPLDMRLEDAMRFVVTAGVNVGVPGVDHR